MQLTALPQAIGLPRGAGEPGETDGLVELRLPLVAEEGPQRGQQGGALRVRPAAGLHQLHEPPELPELVGVEGGRRRGRRPGPRRRGRGRRAAELAREEERISKKKAVELFESGALDKLAPGRFASLQAIHKALFEDIYDFAGELRTVNLAKGNFRFAPLMYLEAALANIDKMPQSTFDEIIEKYVEMNIAHPFREGNGRSTRLWLDQMLKAGIGQVVDWSKVDKEDYLLAMERSPIKDVEIKVLLKAALTDEVNSREVYMKGIDHSYYYEGYTTFKTEDLSKE